MYYYTRTETNSMVLAGRIQSVSFAVAAALIEYDLHSPDKSDIARLPGTVPLSVVRNMVEMVTVFYFPQLVPLFRNEAWSRVWFNLTYKAVHAWIASNARHIMVEAEPSYYDPFRGQEPPF